MSRLVICGGGLAGSLAALALATRRPDIELLLVERGGTFGGNHTWSFFDTDIAPDVQWVVDMVARRRWPDHDIRFPARARTIGLAYNSIQSSDLDSAVRKRLRPQQYRLGAEVSEIAPRSVTIDGERIEADCVIDARGAGTGTRLELGWQKFVGRVYRFAQRHGISRPVIMDATVPQTDGFRFIYLLPLGQTELLIEDTYYSSSPLLDRSALGGRLDAVAATIGSGSDVVSEESGVLPVVIGGRLSDLWPAGDRVPRLGMRGGFFHPTTGYSLPDAVANSALLSAANDLGADAVHRLLRGRAQHLWRQRGFFQLLNRMLFRAAAPEQRYRVLEHFYRLPTPLIARFYAARLTSMDKLRILSGRPPVAIGRALSALRRHAA